MRPDPTPDADTESRIAREQLRSFFRSVRSGQGISVAILCALVAVLWPVAQKPRLFAWCAAMALTVLGRLAMASWFARVDARGGEIHIGQWTDRVRGAVLLQGVCWGLGAVWLYPHGDPAREIFVTMVHFTLGIGAVPTQSMLPGVLPLFAVTVQVPLIVQFMMVPDTSHHTLAGVGVMGLALMRVTERRFHDFTAESLRLRFENEALVRELTASRETSLAANRAKTEFLANMSHEIRTPMNAIQGLAYLSLDADPSPKLRGYLMRIHGASQALLAMLNDILDVSKIEAGRLALERIDFDLPDVLARVTDIAEPGAIRKGLSFTVTMAPDVPRRLVGDPLRLGQVLLNLTSNAVKFTHRGGVSTSVELVRDDGDDVVLAFVVRDTGIGLADAQRERLFEAFFQADASTTRKYGGTGLGLAICRRIVTLMGGEITVVSEADVGSEFRATARLRRSRAEALRETITRGGRKTQPALRPAPSKERLRGVRLLVVEDHELNQQVIREILEASGAHVTLAGNGRECLDALREGEFDGVLMDVQMPIMDGIAATREIRKDPRHAELPILALTANVLVEEVERCREAGMDDHIAKPIQIVELFARLETWVQAREGSSDPAPEAPPSLVAPAAVTAPAEVTPALATVLHIDEAVKRLGGDRGLYTRVIQVFREGEADAAAKIRRALLAGDVALGGRLAHSMKSVAGTLGAARLQEACRAVEMSVRERGATEPAMLDELDAAHAEVLRAIDAM